MSLRCRVWGLGLCFFLVENFGEGVLLVFKVVRVPRKTRVFSSFGSWQDQRQLSASNGCIYMKAQCHCLPL